MEINDFIKQLHDLGDININIDNDNKQIELIIRLIKNCNENCKFCSTNLDKSNIEFGVILNIVEYFNVKYSDFNITFCLSGGEPTLYKELDLLVEKIINKTNNGLKIQTNAVMFYNKYFLYKFTKYKGKIKFFVSFHSHLPKIYNFLTSSKLYFIAFQGIINLYKNFNSSDITLNYVANKINYSFYNDYIMFLIKYFSPYGKINLVFSTMLPNKAHHYKLLLSYDDIINIINDTHKKIGNIDHKINIHYEVGGYCQLPFCYFQKIYFIENMKDYLVGVDNQVGGNLMSKSYKCKQCLYNDKCIGIPKMYLNLYGDESINPIILGDI